jgi:dihydroflavonol-4-reductase
MKVLVTGGTGFVGGHVAAEAVKAGHDVRLLVRRTEQVPLTLAPLGVDVSDVGEVVPGDVLDERTVRKATEGCDAVVHAAAVFSLDARRAQEVLRTNARAAELVLGSAADAQLDPVVHVSSTVALTRRGGSGPDLPLGDLEWPYARSKVASEVIARRLQDDGAPVVSVYPGSVYGPHDPYRGVQSELLRWILRGLFRTYPAGLIHTVHVRTVAETVLAVLEPGRGPRRYVVPGVAVDAGTLYGTIEQVTGRRLRYVVLPLGVGLPSARLTALLQRPLPARWHYPADPEGAVVNACATTFDTRPARIELGVEPVPFEQCIRDTARWLVESGRLRPRYAGKALEPQA